jgi:hypothetical protein
MWKGASCPAIGGLVGLLVACQGPVGRHGVAEPPGANGGSGGEPAAQGTDGGGRTATAGDFLGDAAVPDASASLPDAEAPIEGLLQGTCVPAEGPHDDPCAGAEYCPLAFFAEFICGGAGHGLEFVVTSGQTYMKISFGILPSFEQTLWALSSGGSEFTRVASWPLNNGSLRRGPGDQPVLLEFEPGAVTVHPMLASDGGAPRVEVSGNPLDALFDADGELHVFTAILEEGSGLHYQREAPGPSLPIVTGQVARWRALPIPGGKVGLALLLEEPDGDRLGTWTEEDGLLLGPVLPPRWNDGLWEPPPLLGFGSGPLGEIVASHAAGDGLRLFSLGGDAVPLAIREPLPTDCEDYLFVPYPNVCPVDTIEHGIGVRTSAHASGFGHGGIPWVASLEGESDYRCEWQTLQGCFETAACDCARQATVRFGPLDLVLRSAEALPRTSRLRLAADRRDVLALAEGPDGRLLIALASSDIDASGSRATRLRLLGFDTN